MNRIVVSIALAMTIISCNQEVESEIPEIKQEKIKVETAIVSKNKKSIHLNYTGAITPFSTTPLAFQVPGLVQNVFITEGETVKKGQVLASINKETFQSTHMMAKASQEQAQDAYDRLKKVYDKGSLPEIQWQEMNANLAKANAAESIAKQNLKKCDIVAPVDGVIGQRDLEIGATTTPGISVFQLITIEKVYVRISVPETEISKIQSGQEAKITIPALNNKKYTAVVESIGVVANQFSKTYEVKLLLNNLNNEIKPGMACDIDLTIEQIIDNISIPYNAVLQDDQQNKYVFKVNKANNTVSQHVVNTGLFSNNELVITQGLSEGDLIVIGGHQKLHDQSVITF